MTCAQVHNGLYPNLETITPAEWIELKPVRDSMYCKRHKRYPVTRAVSFNPVPWAMARLVFLSRKKLMKCHILIFKNKVEDLRN